MPTDIQLEQLDHYVDLLLDWNKKINLISRKDEENIWIYHILHCICPLFKIDIKKGSSMVDIGTGGGLPGIPIKILRPDISMLCLDSTSKKVNALSQIITELNLKNIKGIWGRAEEIGLQSDYKNKFDYTIARAVGPLIDLISFARNFLKKQDNVRTPKKLNDQDAFTLNPPALIAFKGGDLSREMKIVYQKQPQLEIDIIDLAFTGSEKLIDSNKKILVVHF